MAALRLINQAGLDLIKSWEGLFLQAYRDIADVWTIGYGHTGGVYKGQMITKSEAERLLAMDLAGHEAFVDARCASIDNQFAPMTSLAFNVGDYGFQSSTVLRRHKEKNFADAADAFLLWDKAHVDGRLVVVPGLLNRRKAERALYLTGSVIKAQADETRHGIALWYREQLKAA